MSKVNRFIHQLTALCLLIMTFIGAINALLRYVGRYFKIALSSNVMIELQWYLFGVILLITSGYVYSQNQHIRVDVFYQKMSVKQQRVLNLLGDLLLLLPFCVVGFWTGLDFFRSSFAMLEQSSDVEGLPRYLIKGFIPIGFFYLAINILFKKR